MKNNKGFSLVELIVVIAIMAILATVAVIGVSVYIPKAQKANDAELVNDIIYAVTLRDYETQFASNGNGVVGYVVVTKNGNVTVGGDESAEIDAALKATFGETYAQELHLSYDSWTDAEIMLDQVSASEIAPYIGSVNQSTYITDIGTDKLLEDVQHCATKFGQFLSEQYKDDPKGATNALLNGFADDPNVEQLLKDAGYETEDDYENITPEVLQNITVFAVATKVQANKQAVIDKFADPDFLKKNLVGIHDLDEIAHWYAALEALVVYLNDEECNKAFYPGFDEDENPTGIDLSGTADQIALSMMRAQDLIEARITQDAQTQEHELYDRYDNYYTAVGGKSQAQLDGEAYVAIMTSVNKMDDEYLNNDSSIKDTNLFDGGALNNRVDTYIAAAQLANDSAKISELKGLLPDGESAVVILACANDGVLDFLLLPAGIIE